MLKVLVIRGICTDDHCEPIANRWVTGGSRTFLFAERSACNAQSIYMLGWAGPLPPLPLESATCSAYGRACPGLGMQEEYLYKIFPGEAHHKSGCFVRKTEQKKSTPIPPHQLLKISMHVATAPSVRHSTVDEGCSPHKRVGFFTTQP